MVGLALLSRALTPPAWWSEVLGSRWSPVASYMVFFGFLFVTGTVFVRWSASISWRDAALVGSCCMSSVHAVLCCLAAWDQIRELPALRLDSKNTPYQTSLAQFSLAYMLSDSLYYVIPFTPTDFMFLVHHSISGLYVVGVLYTGLGAISSTIMFFLGEITSPLLNAVTIFGVLRHTSKACQQTFGYLSPIFAAAFIIIRTVLGVPIVAWFLYTLVFRSRAIPLIWRLPMATCVSLGIMGSQLWTAKLLTPLITKHLADRRKSKA